MEEQGMFANRVDLSALQQSVEEVRIEVRKLIVGQEKMVQLMIAAILADGHILLEGVPGVAKTLAAKLLARTFKANFSRIQFTPDLMPSDVVGTSIFNAKAGNFEFRQGPVFSNLVLIDEINRAPAKTQSALFEVMEERQVTVDGTTYQMEEPFMVIATQNPIEQEGTYQLPEAQLDRFLFKIDVGYPTLEEEKLILAEFHARKNRNDLSVVKQILDQKKIAAYRQTVSMIHIGDELLDYIARITDLSRNHSSLFLGGSPRASLAIMTSAKAFAALSGRDFVTPDDIKNVVTPVLRHRIQLTPEREMEGMTTDGAISQIIETVEVPR
ncbi:MAG: AAA family ATPase [Calditrichia bacterium]